jgi:hypothetical protein
MNTKATPKRGTTIMRTTREAIAAALSEFINDPDLLAVNAQIDDVSGQLAAVERQISATTAGSQRPSDGLTERATALLAGGQDAPPLLRSEARGHIALLADRRRVLTEALRLAIARREALRQTLGARVRAALLPTYRACCAELGEALDAVAEINAEMGSIMEALSSHDIPTGEIRHMEFLPIGRSTDEHSGAARWHREAEEFGLLPAGAPR